MMNDIYDDLAGVMSDLAVGVEILENYDPEWWE